ncbi:DnaJ C-terminal domain-containing protein [Hydrocarboniclastica marina]|uniref:J domain-containing protein n=1 Tax=Hydrocarboniclastica marina TaxID=2259620 RepID=A0A4P7XCU3_9ALTE|nr:DnaJ C-terminal domain-containing protein [Hydrocarboniclastica marina]MAL98798.1 cytochrome C biogenesis protein [Alteromonadaceae bacterium]QCF24679.1 J domain-containing protein [Hydrocarboniclastica marina]|tara:strand:+ start:456 stop:1403 length:948 start_codon:yes stop_codon:yes gene_type:complete
MEFKDYYKILGVDEKASSQDLKAAYRRLARKYHPDVSKEADADERFKEIGEAYEVLKDPDKRSEYDQLKTQGHRRPDGGFEPPPGWASRAHFGQGGFTGADASQFSDFFDAMFGGGRQARGGGWYAMRGDDIHHKLPLFLEEAFKGGEKTISLRAPAVDKQGRVQQRERSLKVKIPAGVADGQHIRLRGQGTPGQGGGEAGDLYLEVQIAPHPLYTVDGRDLSLSLPVTPWEAALGATLKVPTPGGSVQLKIPEGTHSGKRLRLRGRGLPGKPAGDLYVRIEIKMPEHQTERSKKLFRQLAEEVPFNPREHLEKD